MPSKRTKLLSWSDEADVLLAKAAAALIRDGVLLERDANDSAVIRTALRIVGQMPRPPKASPASSPTPKRATRSPKGGPRAAAKEESLEGLSWHLPDGERIALVSIAHNPTWRPLTGVERKVCDRLRARGYLDIDGALTFLGRRVAEARVGWLSVANVEGARERLRGVLKVGRWTLLELFRHPELASAGEECLRVALRLLHDAGEAQSRDGIFTATPKAAAPPASSSTSIRSRPSARAERR